MAGSNIRRRRANKLAIILGMIVLLVAATVFAIMAWQLYKENKVLKKQLAPMEESKKELIVDNEELRAFLEEYKDKGLTREELIKIARERFGLVFPDEILFIPEE